jgi:hypothetical protein
MKIEFTPHAIVHRGSEPAVGNVYSNNRVPAFPYYRVVVGISTGRGHRVPWNCIVCIHVDSSGNVQGSSNNPREYVKNHWDLIGKVKEMPTLKIEWLKNESLKKTHAVKV